METRASQAQLGWCLLLAFPRIVVYQPFDGALDFSGEGRLAPTTPVKLARTAPSEVSIGAFEAQLSRIATYRRFLLQTQA
jgi:hypothetical protein